MSPRPNDLDREKQQDLAYTALAHLSVGEREELLWWMTEHMPHGLLTAIEGLRWDQMEQDGWDQDPAHTPPQ